MIYLLVIPVDLYINTSSRLYYIKQGELFKAKAEWHDDEIVKMRFRILFIPFNVYPLDHWKRSKKRKESHIKKVRSYKYKSEKFKKAWLVLRTFRIKQFAVDLDTGDCIQNAKLYPVFAFLDYRYGGFKINFLGRNSLLLHISNSPIRILKSFI
ncbi:MAG: hypothetical protein HKN00_05350 [Flavobacteriaceae bacterium]|nr:hypothetical protein [Bacteroidia bacterium]NNF74588.1 hypothetical protein [Flavobacteriaceae bacterium]